MTAKVYDVGVLYQGYTTHSTQAGYPIRLTATGQVLAAPGMLIGFYVNSTTAGTIQLFDNPASAVGPSGGLITPAIGMQWYPAVFLTGLFVNIATLDVTFFVIR